MKLLVFKNNRDLNRFWVKGLGKGSLGKDASGAVQSLGYETWRIAQDGTETLEEVRLDPTYFAVMGLIRGNLGMEVITHECGHAAFAYQARVPKGNWPDRDNPQEHFCYPLGRIARGVVSLLADADLF